MKLSHLLGSFFVLLLANTAYAEDRKDAVTIYFNDAETVKSAVYTSYRSMFDIDKQLLALNQIAVQAANATNGPNELYDLDQNFQKAKHQLDFMIKRQTLSFNAFSETVIQISNNGFGEQVIFYLPKVDTTYLGIANNEISTIDMAKRAKEDLGLAEDKINDMLPSDFVFFEKFQNRDALTHASKENMASFSNQENAKIIMDSLVQLNHDLIKKLETMRDLASKAIDIASDNDRANLNAQFQALLSDFDRVLHFSYIGKMKTFNDNHLRLIIDGQQRDYDLPKLNSHELGISEADLSAVNNAMIAMSAINNDFTWIANWSVTGKNWSAKK